MRRWSLLCTVLAVVFVANTAWAGYGRARLLFYLQDTRITESSGVSASARYPNVLFTHNDSGDIARFFAIGARGQTLAAYMLVGTTTAFDWEDMARGPGADRKPALFFADIGDNAQARPFVTVYEVPEPLVNFKEEREMFEVGYFMGPVTQLTYEDGPHDAETFFVDPRTRRFGIVTKAADGESGVYVADPSAEGVTASTLHRVASISFRKFARPYRKTDFGPESRLQATGGDISPDGKRLVVRTYVEAFEWDISKGLAAGVKRKPLRIPLPRTLQGEAIAYTRDGRSLVTTTEQRPSPVHLIPAAR